MFWDSGTNTVDMTETIMSKCCNRTSSKVNYCYNAVSINPLQTKLGFWKNEKKGWRKGKTKKSNENQEKCQERVKLFFKFT